MAGDQKKDAHGRFFQHQKVIIQIQCFFFLFASDGIHHIKNLATDLIGTDSLHVFCLDHFFFHGIAKQFFQFLGDQFHIVTCLTQKQFHNRTGDPFIFFFQCSENPLHQNGVCLAFEFYHAAILFDLLVHFSALVHIFFCENKIGRFRKFSHVCSQFFRAFFEKSAVFHQNNTAFCKKWQCFGQIDQRLRANIFSGKYRSIHGITFHG